MQTYNRARTWYKPPLTAFSTFNWSSVFRSVLEKCWESGVGLEGGHNWPKTAWLMGIKTCTAHPTAVEYWLTFEIFAFWVKSNRPFVRCDSESRRWLDNTSELRLASSSMFSVHINLDYVPWMEVGGVSWPQMLNHCQEVVLCGNRSHKGQAIADFPASRTGMIVFFGKQARESIRLQLLLYIIDCSPCSRRNCFKQLRLKCTYGNPAKV